MISNTCTSSSTGSCDVFLNLMGDPRTIHPTSEEWLAFRACCCGPTEGPTPPCHLAPAHLYCPHPRASPHDRSENEKKTLFELIVAFNKRHAIAMTPDILAIFEQTRFNIETDQMTDAIVSTNPDGEDLRRRMRKKGGRQERSKCLARSRSIMPTPPTPPSSHNSTTSSLTESCATRGGYSKAVRMLIPEALRLQAYTPNKDRHNLRTACALRISPASSRQQSRTPRTSYNTRQRPYGPNRRSFSSSPSSSMTAKHVSLG